MRGIRAHWNWFSVALLALAAGWVALTAAINPPSTGGQIPAPKAGFLAPDFRLTTLAGDEVQLSELRGKAVILNIWASWCPPCREEMPAIQQVYDEYRDQGLEVLALNTTNQDQLADVTRFVEEYRLTFPILLDHDGTAAALYQTSALPSTFFIRPDGTIQEVVIGGPMSTALLRSQVMKLLAEVP